MYSVLAAINSKNKSTKNISEHVQSFVDPKTAKMVGNMSEPFRTFQNQPTPGPTWLYSCLSEKEYFIITSVQKNSSQSSELREGLYCIFLDLKKRISLSSPGRGFEALPNSLSEPPEPPELQL